MAATNLTRNGGVLVAAGGIYIAACYIGYSAVQKNKADIEETELALRNDNFSFISNPNRTDQFQNVASKYDDEIGRDESVMGINLLRRSLLYFHAKGTVLEVGAGTGRNICERSLLSNYCFSLNRFNEHY
jgi:methyltransferase OMS1, mitochondrial